PPATGATVEIANTSGGVLSLSSTTLSFNNANWSTPQLVEVETIGRVQADTASLTQFSLPHVLIAPSPAGATVRTRSSPDLLVDIIPAESSFLGDLGKDLLNAATDELLAEEQEKATMAILDKTGDKTDNVIIKKGLKKLAKATPYIGTALEVIDIVQTFSDRLGAAPTHSQQINSLAQTLFIHHEALADGSLSWDQAFFPDQRFAFPLSLSQGGSREGETGTPSSFNALFSGNVQFSRFDDNSSDLEVDGSTSSYVFGLDVIPHADLPLVTGLHLAFTRSHSDFEDTEISTQGDYELRLFSLHPYVSWDATERLNLWTSVGYGRGETKLNIDSIDDELFSFVEDSSRTRTGDFFSFAAGGNVAVWQSDFSALRLKLEGATSTFLDADVQQGRLAAQFSRQAHLQRGRLLAAADLALLLSSDDPSAMELSGHLQWLPSQGRLSGSTNARVLLFGDDQSEWGIGGGLRLLPGQRGEGLSLSLQPSLGQNGANSLFHDDAFSFDPDDLNLGSQPLTASFQAEVAYGFLQHHALLTPYTKLNLAEHTTTYGAGLRYQLADSLDLDLSASHRQRSSGNNDNRLFLRLRSEL
ncbi:MAG: hypothetical protein TH68_04580, partial [Candidatus Synechococcus spongiarum 142]